MTAQLIPQKTNTTQTEHEAVITFVSCGNVNVIDFMHATYSETARCDEVLVKRC